MKEVWKDIENFEGYYQVSNFGRVKSLNGNRIRNYGNDIILSNSKDRYGYIQVGLHKNIGKRKVVKVHRLVAQAFISNPENKPCINHKDHDRSNNKIDNLEWVTYSENNKDNYKFHGNKISPNYRKFYGDHNNSISVIQLDLDNNFIKFFDSLKRAQDETGINYNSISNVIKNKQKTAGGYKWIKNI